MKRSSEDCTDMETRITLISHIRYVLYDLAENVGIVVMLGIIGHVVAGLLFDNVNPLYAVFGAALLFSGLANNEKLK